MKHFAKLTGPAFVLCYITKTSFLKEYLFLVLTLYGKSQKDLVVLASVADICYGCVAS